MRSGLHTLGFALLGASLAACATHTYAVAIHFPTAALQAMASSVDVYALAACADAPDGGGAPSDASRHVVATPMPGGMNLGDVPPGLVAIYARARDTNCNVFAAGCWESTLEGGGSDTLTVAVQPVSPGDAGCDPGQTCNAGVCVPPDATP